MSEQELKLINEIDPCILNKIHEDGTTIFHTLAKSGSKEVFELILEKIIDKNLINHADNKGHTPLHYISLQGGFLHKGGELWVCELLVNNMSKEAINAITNEQRSALHYAAWIGNKEIYTYLLTKLEEDTIKLKDKYERDALFYAKRSEII